MFFCKILQKNLKEFDDFESYEKKLKLQIKINGGIILPLYKKVIKRYGIDNFEDYISFIKKNFNNEIELNKLRSLYEKNFLIEKQKEELEEKKRLGLLLLNSIKYHSPTVKIRLLIEHDSSNVYELYQDFKINYMKEDITKEECNELIDDQILKNQIYGIFDNHKIVGIMSCDEKRFNIDYTNEKINTFYIQEIVIDTNYNGKSYGSLLISYAILTCPSKYDYISFMTTENNRGMYRIASKLNFIKQEKTSGDPLNPSLFIRINNVVDRKIHKSLNYLKSTTSIYI